MASLQSIENRIDKLTGDKSKWHEQIRVHGNVIPVRVSILHPDGSRELKIDNSKCEYESRASGNITSKQEFEEMTFSEQREFIFTPNQKYQR